MLYSPLDFLLLYMILYLSKKKAKTLTLDQLRKRGWRISNKCLCKVKEEMGDHVSFFCLEVCMS